MEQDEATEFDLGNGQVIVVYVSIDTGEQIDPTTLYRSVAGHARERAARGQRIVSMTSMPLRHSAVILGRDGSGFQTMAAVAVVYETPA